MIRKHNGEFVATCDECGDRLYGGVEDVFARFVTELHDAGWACVKNSAGEWEHQCPSCID
jgi:hypothetical protein